jgi:cytochrome c oxidase assembly protein subunit 15
MNSAAFKNWFRKSNLLTIILLFVLILAGGVVRSTGSGMGCPDWPKCFSGYIPPTSLSQLPKDYQQEYINGRAAKNQKFAQTLDMYGFTDLADHIRKDKSILIPEEFNVARAWTEYVNRLIGMLTGISMFFMAIFSFSYLKENIMIPVLSVINLLLIYFQAWLGSVVVSTNLTAWIVTVHMLVALAILALSIATYYLAKVYYKDSMKIKPLTYIITVVVLIISVIQIVFGTEVRETIDSVANHFQGGYREDWIADAGTIFVDHRSMAILVLVGNVLLYALIRREFSRHSLQQQLMSFTFLMIMLQIVTGIILSHLSLPPYAQAAHLVLASLIFGAQFYLVLNLHKTVSLHGVQK